MINANIIPYIVKMIEDGKKIEIKYDCNTTYTNGEYINVFIGGELYNRFEGSRAKGFKAELQSILNIVKKQYPSVHFRERKVELHFFYHGFNSVGTEMLPFEISVDDESKEVKKPGIKKESYNLVGRGKVGEILDKYSDYEVYVRFGFSFRGAGERKITKTDGWKEKLIDSLKNRVGSDVDIIDDEIHINSFSYNDME